MIKKTDETNCVISRDVETSNSQPHARSIGMYDGCYVELRDGSVRGPVKFRTDIEPHMRPWLHRTEAWFDHGGYRIQGGKSPWDAVRVLPNLAGLELAIAIIEARLPLYTDIGQINALREMINSIRSVADLECG